MLLFAGTALAAGAQSMIEHAAVTGPAAAGATAGAVIGTKLSQSVGILGAAASQGETQAKKKDAKDTGKENAKATAPDASGKKTEPASSNAVPSPGFFQPSPSSGGGGAHPAPLQPMPAPQMVQQQVAIPTVRSAAPVSNTKAQMLTELTGVQKGMSRDEVIGKLGAPAYRITYDADGRMFERLRFRVGPEDVAVVELADGLVEETKALAKP